MCFITPCRKRMMKTERQVSKQREESNFAFSERDLFQTIWTAVTSCHIVSNRYGRRNHFSSIAAFNRWMQHGSQEESVSRVNGSAYPIFSFHICFAAAIASLETCFRRQICKGNRFRSFQTQLPDANMVLFYEWWAPLAGLMVTKSSPQHRNLQLVTSLGKMLQAVSDSIRCQSIYG